MSRNLSFTDPSTLTPLFSVQETVCAYPVSDFYANSPRYLYYSLVFAATITHWSGWLANVFLGAAATYAGVASIEAIILRSNISKLPAAELMTIPYISTPLNSTYADQKAVVTNTDYIYVRPAALELDVDTILAVTVVGYLTVLPMQCWSRVVKKNPARQVVSTIWTCLLLAGAICALSYWPITFNIPTQWKFCYPGTTDPSPLNNDRWPSEVWQGNWNSTVWYIFSNFAIYETLSDNCYYPCFNTTQILRRTTTLTATDYDPENAARLNAADSSRRRFSSEILPNLMYLAVGLSTACLVFLLVVAYLKKISNVSRIPVGEPKHLWHGRKEVAHFLLTDFKGGLHTLSSMIRSPRQAFLTLHQMQNRRRTHKILQILQFGLDVLTILVLAVSMIISPITIVGFVIWIEFFIKHDSTGGELPTQVGQWATWVSVLLILVSATVYRFKYFFASTRHIEQEITELEIYYSEQRERLTSMLAKRESKRS